MTIKASIPTAIAVILLSNTVSARDCTDLSGKWTNDLGAIMTFDTIDIETGQITGGYHPKSAPEMRFPLTGFVNPNGRDDSDRHYAVPVSITVSFGEFGGITNWSGTCRMDTGTPRIETEDLIIAPMADYDWAHVITNHDTLVPKD